LSVFFSSIIVGHFALGNRLLGIPSALLGHAVAQVFFQRASELRSSNSNLTEAVEGAFRQLVNVSLFPAMLLTLMGRDLVVLIFGSQWAEAGLYLQILSVGAFFQFIFSPISTLFVVIERQDLALVVHGSLFLSRLLVFLLGGLGGDARMTIGLYTITGACVYGALVIWNLRLSGSSARYAAGVVGRNLTYCLPAIVVLVLTKWWFKPPTVILIGAAFLVLGGYLVFLAYSDLTVRRLLTALFDRAKDVLTRSKSPQA
jgi:O-antigen/teichoic acid export membrane protein